MQHLNFFRLLTVGMITLLAQQAAFAQEDGYYSTLRQQLQDEYQLSGGDWTIGGSEDSVLARTNYYGSLTVSEEAVTDQDFTRAVRIQVDSAGPFVYSHAYNFVSQAPIGEGDVLLLSVWLRNVQPDERASIELVFEQNEEPYNKVRTVPLSFGSTEWEQVLVPLTANASFAAEGSHFHINVGQKTQTIEVGGVAVINYGDAYPINDLPEVIPVEPVEEDAYYAGLREQLNDEYGVSGGEWLIGGDEATVLGNRIGYGAEISDVPVDGQPFRQALRVQVTEFGPESYSQGLFFTTPSPVAQGDVVLLTFYVRNVGPEASQVEVNLEENGGNFTKTFLRTVDITSDDWQQIIVPAQSVIDHPGGIFKFQLNLGLRAQEFEVGGIALLNYEDAYTTQQLPSSLPNRTYEGSEPGAAWRAAAQQRIETERKGDLTVSVVDAAGNPVPDAQVHIDMQQHAFGFGTAVSIPTLTGAFDIDSANVATYREKLYDLTGDGRTFTIATPENMLKWTSWENANPDFVTKEEVVEQLDRLRSIGMAIRGHNLVWGSARFLPADIAEELGQDNPDLSLIQQRIRERIPDVMQYPGIYQEIREWDVTNEPLHEGELYDALIGNFGYTGKADILADWMRWAHEADSTTGLFLNEYDIWTNNPFYRSEYKKLAEEILAQGVPLTGLGVQGHMGSTLTPIETLYTILDDLATTGLDLSITEYDAADINDDSLAAAYLRDAMTVAFSHPSTTSFIMWGFWDGNHWLGDAPLFYEDWTPKPAYYEYVDLVFNQWWTNEAGQSDAEGQYAVRGFLGEYDVRVILGEDTVVQTATLRKEGTTVIVEVEAGNRFPGLVQAENFTGMRGVKVAPSRDEDGTDAVVDLDHGDYVDYEVSVRESGMYRFSYRVARERWGAVAFALQEEGQTLHYGTSSLRTPAGQWTEVEAYAYLDSGEHAFRVLSIGRNWKLNWLAAEVVDMSLPGQIEAEAFTDPSGYPLVLPSGDEDQTAAVTFLHKGTSVSYPVNVSQTGTYEITYRIRNIARRKASFTLQLGDQVLQTVSVKRDRRSPFGWQEVTATAELPAGEHTLRLMANQAGGSLNWWRAEGGDENARVATLSDKIGKEDVAEAFSVYPNPTAGWVQLRLPTDEATQITVYDLQGRPVLERTLRPQSAEVDLQELSSGMYLLRAQSAGQVYQQQIVVDR